MEKAIVMVQYMVENGNALIVAVLNVAANCNVSVSDLLAQFK